MILFQGNILKFVEQADIVEFYTLDGFHNAMSYDVKSLRPDVLLMTAKIGGIVAGMAGASSD
jgi:hypothetical protein